MNWKDNWLGILIVFGIVFSILVSFYMTQGIGDFEPELVLVAGQNSEVQAFVQRYPGSEPNLIRIAPKGIFSIKEGDMLDPNFGNYKDDPLVGLIGEHEFGSAFPDIWIIVYSPNLVGMRGYVAPHPPNPAAYVFFDSEKQILFVEVLE